MIDGFTNSKRWRIAKEFRAITCRSRLRRADRHSEIPEIGRRFTAYTEGWGLYSELTPKEIVKRQRAVRQHYVVELVNTSSFSLQSAGAVSFCLASS